MSEMMTPSVSLIVPTYKEAENLPELIDRIQRVRSAHQLDLELWIMDDDSQDGTMDVVRSTNLSWITLVVRRGDRGLSQAVLDGMRRATKEVLVVMDADLSHPPERIPDLLAAISNGADFAIGSRYAPGGTVDSEWGPLRRLNSRVATVMARPLTRARDPMSGFFALRRERYLAAGHLNPVGYKIGLELIVKCACERVAEIPIDFGQRRYGSSKLTFAEQLRYLQHLRRLMIHKYPEWSSIVQFAVVGASGTLVNLGVVTLLSFMGAIDQVAIAAGIGVSVVSNFVLNRRFSFSYALDGPLVLQFAGFVAASAAGMVVNYTVAVGLRTRLGLPLALAVCCGIIAGMGLNFVANRFLVFRRRTRNPRSASPAATP